MKAVGIVRKIDELGRVVIPKELRDKYNWKTGQPLEIFTDNDRLVLQGYRESEEKQEVIKRLEEVKNGVEDDGLIDALTYSIDYLKKE